jgi:cellulose synthase/poly-beta-1,6-N-acetylglucosamine synthase-like glycosyltransferase
MLPLVLLALAGAILVYALAAYPLLLRLSRRSGPPIRKDPGFQPSVTAIVPVSNGAAFLRGKLAALRGLEYPQDRLDIIVVSDGSTDGTDGIAAEFADRGVRLLRVPRRSGKANAVNLGLAGARGELVFFTDVRQHFRPDALARLAANFADPSVGMVSGELHLLRGARGEQADMNLYWRYELWARARHSRIDSVFNATGCIYAMRRSLTAPLPPDMIADDAILPLRAFRAGYRLILEPEAIAYDYPALPGTEFRRRLRTLAGLWQVFFRMRWLFTRENRMRFHFLSHKFVRLLLPWAVLLFAGATVALPAGGLRTALLAAELGGCFLALLDRLIPGRWGFKRVSSPCRTFLSMNAAAALAMAVFFFPAQDLWRPTRVRQ